MKTRLQIARDVIAGYYGSGDNRIAALKKEGYNPEKVQGDVNTLLCCRENIINNMKSFAVKIADDNRYRYIYFTEQYGRECAVCHPHGGANRGWQCIGFGCACWHHGGVPSKCHCGVIDNGTGERIYAARTDALALSIAKNALGIKDVQVIRNNGGIIPKSKIQPGDIGLLFNGDEFQHLIFCMSQTKVADATSTGGNHHDDIRADRNFSKYYENRLKVLIRYTGNGLCPAPKRTIDELAYEVIDGLWGSGDSRQTALTQAGHDYNAVQKRVNEILDPTPKPTPTPTPSKETTLIAVDVINGDYGSGDARVKALKKAGYNPTTIQNEVNRLMSDSRKKSIDTLAREVIDGYWRSGKKREKVLKACGCNYDAIQNRVNEILNPPKPQPKKYTGQLPTMTIKKSNQQVINDTIEWAKWIAADNSFHYGVGDDAHHNGCYFCDTQPASKKKSGIVGWEKTYCCNPFVGAAWAHGGCVPTAHNMCLTGRSWDFNIGTGYDASSLFSKLGKPAQSNLRPGDVLCNGHHVVLYIGNGKIAEASGGDDNVRNSSRWNNSIHITNLYYGNFDRVYRYNSSVDATYSIMHGEVSDRVALLQAFLNWYGGYNLVVDREFGDKTYNALKDYQNKKGLVADGIAGPATLKAMEGDAK